MSFYVIVDGLSATLEDSTLQEKPLFNDRSSVPSLSKLVTARTLQRFFYLKNDFVYEGSEE